MSKVLVTGGAGYIGSHVTHLLCEAGHDVVVFDNLSTGHRSLVDARARLHVGDLADHADVAQLLAAEGFDSILHFAASIIVPESVEKPFLYYTNNTVNTTHLIQAANAANVQHFIFSSTAAVYGEPDGGPVSEQAPTIPMSPYGWSKLFSEQILDDICAQSEMNFVVLRYFNVAGAHHEQGLGQIVDNATHLIKVACEVSVGKRESISVFGTDYNTADGSCIRDYIHVRDLAAAHIDALNYLADGGESCRLNCGYGNGFSVLDVLNTFNEIAPAPISINMAGRRAGDPPMIVAKSDKIVETIGWQPQFADLPGILKDALIWERRQQEQNT